MEFEEAKPKPMSKKWKVYYYGVLFVYISALSHMVVVSVIPSPQQSEMQVAFTTPLVIVSLMIPFHLELTVSTYRI